MGNGDGVGRAQTVDSDRSRVPHLTAAERAARGKAARGEVPRRAHGEWEPAPARPDPVAVLEEQARSRVPELVPIRYGRMLVSPFAFFRGSAAIMAADLADGPRTALQTQLCGDAHLSNFGIFATPDRGLTFDLNDFDETLPGPFEWDLKRLVTSFAVAGRERDFARKVRARGCAPLSSVPTARRCRSSHPCARSSSGTRASTSTQLARSLPGAGVLGERQATRARSREGPDEG